MKPRKGIVVLGLALVVAVAALSLCAEEGYWKFTGERFVKGKPFLVGPNDPTKVEAAGGGSAINTVYTQRTYRSVVAFSWTADSGLAVLKPKTKITFTGLLTHSGDPAGTAGITLQPYGQPPGTGHSSGRVIVAGLVNVVGRSEKRSGVLDVPPGPLYPDKKMELRFEASAGGATSALYRTYEWIGGGEPIHTDMSNVKKNPKPEYISECVLKGIRGSIRVKRYGSEVWEDVPIDRYVKLDVGDSILTGPDTRADLEFQIGLFRVKSNTEIRIFGGKMELITGGIKHEIQVGIEYKFFQVITPSTVCGPMGTKYFLFVEQRGLSQIFVTEGKVKVSRRDGSGEVIVHAGQTTSVAKGGFPSSPRLFAAGEPETLFEQEEDEAASGTADWSGSWATNFNAMTLVQKGNRVTGTYAYKGGRIEGTVQGSVLKGKWFQSNGSGSFEFRLAADGRSFKGRWGNGQTLTGGVWNGRR